VRLAKRLDGLPLALATAGMYLSQTSEGLSGYLDAYEENWHELSDDAEELLDYEGRTLFSTWNLSFMHVQSQDPDAAECLRLLAYFGNLEIWYDLFRVKFRDGIPWLSRVTENKRRFERAMARLHDYSLVEISAESYSLHSCVHDWTLHILNRNISKVYCRVALRCIAGNVMSASEKDYWQNNQRLVHHAKRLEHSRLSQTLDDEALDESYAGDLNYLGILWALQGELGKAEKIYQRALAGCETALGAEHMSTINIINNLGLLYRDQRKLAEAEKMFHRALVGYETALGAENTWILNTFNNLGLVYIDQGKLTEAEKMLHQALTGKEMAFGAEHTSTLNTIHHLGMMYRDQGKLAEAEKMLHQALIGYETRLGAEHAWMLDTIHTLGLVYRDQGKLTEAEKMLHQALRGYETTLGAEHTSTLHTLNNLGVLYTDQGKLAEAEKMYRRSLTGYETALGAEHTSTLRTLNNLGFLYRDQGKLKETEKMYRRSLAGCGTALGAEHMSTLAAVNDLISVLLQRYWEQLFQSEGPIGNQSPILIDIIKLAQEWAGRSPKAFKALGRALLWISDEQNAQIAFQQQLKLQEAPSHHADAHCDGCRLLLDYSMTRFICKHCRDVDACKDCYVKHETGVEKLATCSNHAFLEVSLEELSKANGIKHLGETGRDLWVQHLLTKYYQ
jgi:tetratricopeptide (TPR) repeat protein